MFSILIPDGKEVCCLKFDADPDKDGLILLSYFELVCRTGRNFYFISGLPLNNLEAIEIGGAYLLAGEFEFELEYGSLM